LIENNACVGVMNETRRKVKGSSRLLEERDGLRQESALERGVEAEGRVLGQSARPELRRARSVDGKGCGA
jgi:hypothetical protein